MKKRITVVDGRHFSYLNGAGLSPEIAAKVKALQMPTQQGVWETIELTRVLGEMGIIPNLVGHSPQPRARLMAEMVAKQSNWQAKLKELPELNDLGSDPNSKSIMPLLKDFAAQNGCSLEEAIIRQPDAKHYIFRGAMAESVILNRRQFFA